ncbi:histone-fold-containing protein [Exophiala viscosa]|uniref:Histone H3 n=2 Tax=Exophiala viscosa TaxID=2486360 RepID=A0AAN6IF55_9EURO|nr:histone-fold-containing protein [Exophiala viscosa]
MARVKATPRRKTTSFPKDSVKNLGNLPGYKRPAPGAVRPRNVARKGKATIAPRKKPAGTGKKPLKRTFPRGTLALREIRKLQQVTNLLMPKAPFQRLVREITNEIKEGTRFQASALGALQESAERADGVQ